MVLFAVEITSIRLAVKLATYRRPRLSSRARSTACPPIDTTLPNVPAQALVARHSARLRIQYRYLVIIRRPLSQTQTCRVGKTSSQKKRRQRRQCYSPSRPESPTSPPD